MQGNDDRYPGSVAEPRAPLLHAVLRFVLDARACQGVLRIALIGSLTTPKPLPNCGRRDHLNDDLQVITLTRALIAAPPVELWPEIRRRVPVPGDVEELLLAALGGNG